MEQPEIARRTERAWMVSFTPRMPFNEGTFDVDYECEATNVGRTPSRIVEVGIGFAKTARLSNIPQTPIFTEKKQFNKIVLAPNDCFPVSARLSPKLAQEEWQAVREGKLFLYAYGFITYLDVFGKSKRHIRETRFCHRSGPSEPNWPVRELYPCPFIEAPPEYHRAT